MAFIIIYSKKNFYQKKEHLYSSNTKRAFALLLDFTILNALNFLYILLKVMLDEVYRQEFSVFADYVFHHAGTGLAGWFLRTQLKLLLFYSVYSLIFEITPLRSTFSAYHMGLKVTNIDGKEVSIGQVILRNIIKPISILLWPVFAVISNLNRSRSWIHDLLSKTAVIDREKLL